VPEAARPPQRGEALPGLAQTRQYLLVPIWLNGKTAVMTKSIEDILACIHDEDEYTKLGRIVREVDAHLVPLGHYTAKHRDRTNLGTQLSDRITDMIHNTSRRRRA
jgi:hypothetical protein